MTGHAPAQTRTAQDAASRLRRRRDFLRAATGDQFHAPCFKLQGVARTPDEPGPPRIGFTVTKKVAGAVGRNRIVWAAPLPPARGTTTFSSPARPP